ncbi:MAG: hypothetical protein M0C28_37105 [Candidatus Moduliflexus flocculans]|nr:hypothetical protein [Candidatus Moduliflexus flocculans]
MVLDLTAAGYLYTNFLNADPVENLPPRALPRCSVRPRLDSVLTAPDRRRRRPVAADTHRVSPENGKVRVVLDLVSIGQHKVFPLNDPYRHGHRHQRRPGAEFKAELP